MLIFGATGRIGSALNPLLIEQGSDVSGVTRSAVGAASLTAAGVTPVVGDIRDLSTIETQLTSYDSVFLASADAPDQASLEIGVIEALAEVSKAHVVKLSAQSAGLSPPVSFGIQHRLSEEALRNSGLSYTILRPTFFQQSVLLMSDDVAKKQAIVAPMGSGRSAMVDVRDVADVAARCLIDPRHANETYTLTGPEPQGFAEVVDQLSDLLGHPVKYTSPPLPIARMVMPFLTGMPRWQTKLIIDLMVAIKQGDQESVTADVESVTGRPPRNLADFLAENLEVFRS